MIKKLQKPLAIFGLGLISMVLIANFCLADVPTATSTLDTVMTTVINTTVSLVVTVFQTYWPYILVFGILSGLIGAFYRFAHLGSGGHGRR